MNRPSPDAPEALAVLPARIGSSRLERKVLLDETGLPLVVHSARNAARARRVSRVVVATDSDEVVVAARQHGLEVVLTDPAHPSGTDRVREALDRLVAAGAREPEVVLNVQADEPDLEPADLDALVAAFEDPAVEVATLSAPLGDAREHELPTVVKVVTGAAGDALYFSRAPIPSNSHPRAGAPGLALARRHVGVYAFRPDALRRFCDLPVGTLEAQENLEQLRWLEAGGRMRVLPGSRVPRGIDTRADYDDFVARSRASQGTA